jgi:hypothetical protein
MSLAFAVFEEKSRLSSLLDHFSTIEDPREPWRVAHPLQDGASSRRLRHDGRLRRSRVHRRLGREPS